MTLAEIARRKGILANYKREGDALRAIPAGTTCGCGACNMTPTTEYLAEVKAREDEIEAWVKEAETAYRGQT